MNDYFSLKNIYLSNVNEIPAANDRGALQRCFTKIVNNHKV